MRKKTVSVVLAITMAVLTGCSGGSSSVSSGAAEAPALDATAGAEEPSGAASGNESPDSGEAGDRSHECGGNHTELKDDGEVQRTD